MLSAQKQDNSDQLSLLFTHGQPHVRKKRISTCISKLSLKQWLLLAICLTVLSFFALNEYVPTPFHGWIRIPPKPNYCCHRFEPYLGNVDYSFNFNSTTTSKSGRLQSDSKVLVFVETQYSKLGKQIIEILESVRFKYKLETAGKNLPLLTHLEKGRYSVIIFENLNKYFKLNKWNRDLLDKYCREYNVGIIGFLQYIEQNNDNFKLKETSTNLRHSRISKQLDHFPIYIETVYQLKDYQLNPRTSIHRISRPGAISLGIVPETNWFIFKFPQSSSTFFPIAQALPTDFITDSYPGAYKYSDLPKHNQDNSNISFNYQRNLLTTVIQDVGSFDGIKRVIFGHGLSFWLHKLIFYDALTYLSNGKLSLPLQRYVQIDIDDIFVGEKGTRMKAADAQALIDFQDRLQEYIPGFRFNLGFSGKYYHRGYPDENEGDDYLIKNANKFWWFCHTFSHSQAHLTTNDSYIENELVMNREFAKANKLRLYSGYTVSPHHSGVYPVHEPLYDAWKKVWNVRVTSTEEYPHLRPGYLRRGFIYKDIMVLPRQTCGLYTHTIYIDKYPGGRSKLETSIFGGDLFETFINQQINVFMTHQSNYANDRLALYTFESVLKFVQCWTNLQLLTFPPLQLAKKYFELYPEDKDPIWMNPCEDKRHYNIWSPFKSCSQIPKFIILGPQKTGSTALYSFLSIHPSVIKNLPSPETFEEIQFFNGKNYYKGLDWYMNFFPIPNTKKFPNLNETFLVNSTNTSSPVHYLKNQVRTPPVYSDGPPYFFEKSSTYFDSDLAAMRVHSLLPHCRLIVILLSPLRRAYSWYQHMKAHNNPIALNFTFYEVISLDVDHSKLNDITFKKLRDLRNRCLVPGTYAFHLERWLSFFPPQQIMIVDGDELRNNPFNIMDKVQTFLKLYPHIDYRKRLRFEPKKGFYCAITRNNTSKCLGKSKGRTYLEMDERSKKYLHRHYLHHNVVLSKLLNRLRVPIPLWLKFELSMNL